MEVVKINPSCAVYLHWKKVHGGFLLPPGGNKKNPQCTVCLCKCCMLQHENVWPVFRCSQYMCKKRLFFYLFSWCSLYSVVLNSRKICLKYTYNGSNLVQRSIFHKMYLRYNSFYQIILIFSYHTNVLI